MSEHNHNPAYKTMMDALVKDIPSVKASKAFGYPAYKVNGRVFAFVGTGVALKLPAARVLELVAEHPEMKPFEVGEGVVWREWVSINTLNSENYVQYVEWIEESLQFVAGG